MGQEVLCGSPYVTMRRCIHAAMLPEALGFVKLGHEFDPPVEGFGDFVFRVNLRFDS